MNCALFGAGGRTRTDTSLRTRDFESRTSTDFITPAFLTHFWSFGQSLSEREGVIIRDSAIYFNTFGDSFFETARFDCVVCSYANSSSPRPTTLKACLAVETLYI